jgi:hypothetical protein
MGCFYVYIRLGTTGQVSVADKSRIVIAYIFSLSSSRWVIVEEALGESMSWELAAVLIG